MSLLSGADQVSTQNAALEAEAAALLRRQTSVNRREWLYSGPLYASGRNIAKKTLPILQKVNPVL